MIKKLLLLSLALFSFLALAQVVANPDQAFIDQFLSSLKSYKDLQTTGLIAVAVQLLMKFMDTSWFNKWVPLKAKAWKLPAISLLTIVGGMLTLVSVDHLTWGAAAINSTTLSAVMVFAHQWMKWFSDKPAVEVEAGAKAV